MILDEPVSDSALARQLRQLLIEFDSDTNFYSEPLEIPPPGFISEAAGLNDGTTSEAAGMSDEVLVL